MSGDIGSCVLFCENMALRSVIARCVFVLLHTPCGVGCSDRHTEDKGSVLRKSHAFLSSSDLAQTFRGQKEGPRHCFLSMSLQFLKQLQQEGLGRGLVFYDASFSSVHCSYHYSAPSFCIFFSQTPLFFKRKKVTPKIAHSLLPVKAMKKEKDVEFLPLTFGFFQL